MKRRSREGDDQVLIAASNYCQTGEEICIIKAVTVEFISDGRMSVEKDGREEGRGERRTLERKEGEEEEEREGVCAVRKLNIIIIEITQRIL